MTRKDIINYSAECYARGVAATRIGNSIFVGDNLEILIKKVYMDAFRDGESYALHGDNYICCQYDDDDENKDDERKLELEKELE